MPFPIPEFWKLAVESRLFSSEECQRLEGAFAQIKGAMDTGNAFTLSEWLISQKVLTRYQAKVLLARRPGPFVYGDYRVQERIDSGRMQGLFRAIHLPTRQTVCLYFLSSPLLQDPASLSRLKQALNAAAAVRHVHLARLYHAVDLETYKFAVLADLQGRTLEDFLAAKRTFTPAEACRMVRQAALGLAELHASGQTHAAIRPANLWQDPAGNIKLIHVPVSRDPLAPPPAALLAAGQMDPTVEAAADYLAPDLHDHPLGDIYALGCTLYHLLVGQPPFAGGDVPSKLRRHASEQPPLASQLNPQVPLPVAQVVAYLMAKDPASRYQQAAHVADALAPYVDPAARQPIKESASSTSQAYEAWLQGQPAPPTVAAAIPGSPQVPWSPGPVATPSYAPVAPAPAVAIPMMTAPPVATPVMGIPISGIPATAVAATPAPAVAVQAAPAIAAPAALAVSSAPAPAISRSALAAQRKEKQAADQRNKLIIGVGGVLTVLIVGFLVWSGSRKPTSTVQNPPLTPTSAVTKPNEAATASNPSATVPASPVAPATPIETGPPEEPLTSISGNPLWDSPTSGAPVDLRYLPATPMYLALRPAEIWAHAEGRQVLSSLGIENFVRDGLQRLTGSTPDNLEHVVISFAGRGMGQPPAVALVARTVQSVEKDALKAHWKAEEEWEIEGKTLIRGEGYTYYLPEEGQNKLVVAVPITEAKELSAWLAASKSQPLLSPKLERLARFSDSKRLVSLLAAPGFLTGEGRGAMLGTLDPLLEPIMNFLMDDAGQTPAAALASLHLADGLFLELRLSSDSDQGASDLAKLYYGRVENLEEAIERFCGSLSMSSYSQPIMLRYPGFFDFVAENTRGGINTSDKHVVLRTALPAVAASNLAFGTHLAMLEKHGSGVTAVATVPQTPAGPSTLADRLKQKYTLSFDRDSLERTLDLISKDTGIPIRIEGGDLQLEGITKNQSFGLDEKDKPIFEILITIMKKANPDGKLIYVFQKMGGEDTVVVTTRAAAAKRKDTIPPELQ